MLNLFIPISKIDAQQRLVYGCLSEETPDKSGEILDYESSKPAFQKWSDEQHKISGGKSKGNLRAMHEKVAAGKFTEISFDDDNKRINGIAKVVDDAEWAKVESGVYCGFSIGGGYAKRWKDAENPALTRYTPELAEVSLVDNPCVPTATFEFIKQDGSTELRKFNTNQEAPMTEEKQADAAQATTETAAAEVKKATDSATPETEGGLEKAAETPAAETGERPQDKGGVVQGFMAKDGSFHIKKADALSRNVEVDAEAVAAPALEAVKNLTEAVAKAETGEIVKEEPAEDAPAAETPAAETPAPEAAKAAPAPDLEKGMYAVGNFASLLQSVQCVQQDSEWEATYEGDNSELPGKLKAWLADGATLLVQMVGEEAAELTAEKAAGGDLAKKGAALSAATKGHIDNMMKSATDHLDAMGKCYKALGMGEDAEKSNKGDLAKGADAALLAENNALKKVLSDITPQIVALTKQVQGQQAEIKKLADQPLPPKGSLRAVEKTNDGGNVPDGDAVTKAQNLLKGMSTEEVNMVLMKTALSNPMTKN